MPAASTGTPQAVTARSSRDPSSGWTHLSRVLPYFWSDQLGMKLQMIGRVHGAQSVEIEETAPSPAFIARYRRWGRLVGVFAAGVPRAIGARGASSRNRRRPSACAAGASSRTRT
jgi:hypothetical protein